MPTIFFHTILISPIAPGRREIGQMRVGYENIFIFVWSFFCRSGPKRARSAFWGLGRVAARGHSPLVQIYAGITETYTRNSDGGESLENKTRNHDGGHKGLLFHKKIVIALEGTVLFPIFPASEIQKELTRESSIGGRRLNATSCAEYQRSWRFH